MLTTGPQLRYTSKISYWCLWPRRAGDSGSQSAGVDGGGQGEHRFSKRRITSSHIIWLINLFNTFFKAWLDCSLVFLCKFFFSTSFYDMSI